MTEKLKETLKQMSKEDVMDGLKAMEKSDLWKWVKNNGLDDKLDLGWRTKGKTMIGRVEKYMDDLGIDKKEEVVEHDYNRQVKKKEQRAYNKATDHEQQTNGPKAKHRRPPEKVPDNDGFEENSLLNKRVTVRRRPKVEREEIKVAQKKKKTRVSNMSTKNKPRIIKAGKKKKGQRSSFSKTAPKKRPNPTGGADVRKALGNRRRKKVVDGKNTKKKSTKKPEIRVEEESDDFDIVRTAVGQSGIVEFGKFDQMMDLVATLLRAYEKLYEEFGEFCKDPSHEMDIPEPNDMNRKFGRLAKNSRRNRPARGFSGRRSMSKDKSRGK